MPWQWFQVWFHDCTLNIFIATPWLRSHINLLMPYDTEDPKSPLSKEILYFSFWTTVWIYLSSLVCYFYFILLLLKPLNALSWFVVAESLLATHHRYGMNVCREPATLYALFPLSVTMMIVPGEYLTCLHYVIIVYLYLAEQGFP